VVFLNPFVENPAPGGRHPNISGKEEPIFVVNPLSGFSPDTLGLPPNFFVFLLISELRLPSVTASSQSSSFAKSRKNCPPQ